MPCAYVLAIIARADGIVVEEGILEDLSKTLMSNKTMCSLETFLRLYLQVLVLLSVLTLTFACVLSRLSKSIVMSV